MRELDQIRVKGKERPSRIFELIDFSFATPEQIAMAGLYEEGLRAYRSREWDRALEHFQAALSSTPDDVPSQVYIRRCERFLKEPPPADWDGVFVMKTK